MVGIQLSLGPRLSTLMWSDSGRGYSIPSAWVSLELVGKQLLVVDTSSHLACGAPKPTCPSCHQSDPLHGNPIATLLSLIPTNLYRITRSIRGP